jgi:hypothetical protein
VWKANPDPETSSCNQNRKTQSFEELHAAVSDEIEAYYEAGQNCGTNHNLPFRIY